MINSALPYQPALQSFVRVDISYTEQTSTQLHTPNGSYRSETSYASTATIAAAVYEKPVPQNNPYAQNILNAIQAQLLSDVDEGASHEDLQSRLAAGFEGFVEGYESAYEQLSASGALSDEVTASIEQTYSQVLDGVAALAERFGLESPVGQEAGLPQLSAVEPQTATSVQETQAVVQSKQSVLFEAFAESSDAQLVKLLRNAQASAPTYGPSSATSVAVGESRSFSFEVQTADGDQVTISASALRTGFSQAQSGNGSTSLSFGGSQSSQFEFAVEGELDEGELSALNDLLGQVNAISELFFAGDVAGAFERALSVSFDTNELVGFEYHARMASVERVEQRSVLPEPRFSEPALQSFIDQVDYAAELAERIGQPRSLVADLVDLLSRQIHQHQPQSNLVAPVVDRLL